MSMSLLKCYIIYCTTPTIQGDMNEFVAHKTTSVGPFHSVSRVYTLEGCKHHYIFSSTSNGIF